MTTAAKNLEAIQQALHQHARACGADVREIQMNPFEVDRLDFETFRGIPVKPAEDLGTGRFRLVCADGHGEAPGVRTSVERPVAGQLGLLGDAA